MGPMIEGSGLTGPEPSWLARRIMEALNQGQATIVVNERPVSEQVAALIRAMGYDAEIEDKGSEYHIHISKSAMITATQLAAEFRMLLLVTSPLVGEGSTEQGRSLRRSMFQALAGMPHVLSGVVFLNSAVALTTQGSEILDHLMMLEQAGVEILTSASCLDHYQLRDQLMVGQAGSMFTILERIAASPKVVTL